MFDIIYRFDPQQSQSRQSPADVEEAKRLLEQGNHQFATMLSTLSDTAPSGSYLSYFDLEDLGINADGGALKQQPFAIVLGCSDARVPTELIFDRACNELFVVRVAGHVVGQEQLGSISYAVEHLGQNLKLIVVLGHSQCGAVSAAVDAFLNPVHYLGYRSNHQLRTIVNSIFPAVRTAVAVLEVQYGEDVIKHSDYRVAVIETAVVLNAALAALILAAEYGSAARDLRIVFGVYELASRRVHVPHSDQDGAETPAVRLLDAPESDAAFREFALQVGRSAYIRKILI